MPIDRSKYPENWDALCADLKRNADWKCEECEAQHGTVIYRERGTERWTESLEFARTNFWRGYYRSETQLQVAHLGIPKPDGAPGDKSDTMDCRPENLKVLCRRCHLAFDLPENIPQRRRTRLRRRRERAEKHGQMQLVTHLSCQICGWSADVPAAGATVQMAEHLKPGGECHQRQRSKLGVAG